MIDVYSLETPNGVKTTIALEELGEPYTLMKVDLSAGKQKRPDFL